MEDSIETSDGPTAPFVSDDVIKVEIKEEPYDPDDVVEKVANAEHFEVVTFHCKEEVEDADGQFSGCVLRMDSTLDQVDNKVEIKEEPYDPDEVANAEHVEVVSFHCKMEGSKESSNGPAAPFVSDDFIKVEIKEEPYDPDEVANAEHVEVVSFHCKEEVEDADGQLSGCVLLMDSTLDLADNKLIPGRSNSYSEHGSVVDGRTDVTDHMDISPTVYTESSNLRTIQSETSLQFSKQRASKRSRVTPHSPTPGGNMDQYNYAAQVSLTNSYEQTHTRAKPYRCAAAICNSSFDSESELSSHKRIHGRKSQMPYACAFCNAQFKRQVQFYFHTQTHAKEEKSSNCRVSSCNLFSGRKFKQAGRHLGVHSCVFPGCKAVYSKRVGLIYHRRIHIDFIPYRCNYAGCDVVFSSKSQLICHKQTHIKISFDCKYPGCNYSSTKRSELIIHTRRHLCKKPFKWNYVDCKAAFTHQSGVNNHIEGQKNKKIKLHKQKHTTSRSFKCNYAGCNAWFSARGRLHKHFNKHLGKAFKCDVPDCSKAYCGKGRYQYHVKQCQLRYDMQMACKETDSSENNFKCSYRGCPAVFVYFIDLTEHKLIHAAAKPYKCNIVDCGKTFGEKRQLDGHERKHGVLNLQTPKVLPPNFKCTYKKCSAVFTTLSGLTDHKILHSGPHKCSVCDASFTQKVARDRHVRSHGVTPYKCDLPDCTASFEKSISLIHHKLKHTGERPFKCHFEGCGATHLSKVYLNRHIRINHVENTFKCDMDYCDKSFNKEDKLFRHKKWHESQEKWYSTGFPGASVLEEYTCDNLECRAVFPSLSHLLKHKILHDPLPHMCDFPGCIAGFKNESSLNEHKKLHNPKLYTCSSCPASFIDKCALNYHIRTHTGDKPYKCNFKECDAAFCQPAALKKHKLIHTGVRHKCEHCPASYVLKSQLTNHTKKHLLGKSYECDVDGCGKAYYTNTNLVAHKKRSHQELMSFSTY